MKKLLLIFSILLIFLISITILIIILQNNRDIVDSQTSPTQITSAPISYVDTSKKLMEISFDYQQPAVSIDKKYNDQIISFSSKSEDESIQIEVIDPAHIKVKGDGYTVFIFGVGESSTTNGSVVVNNKAIKSKFNSQIYRVDDSNNQNMRYLLQNYSLGQFNSIEYYTDRYDVGCFNQFDSSKYCGVNSIRLNPNAKGASFDIGISCLVNDISKSTNCDEIIKNLEYKYL